MNRTVTLLWMLTGLIFFIFASCRGCGEKGPEHILGLVDATSALVVHVPDVDRLRRGLDGFLLRATRKASPKLTGAMRDKLKDQLGFDPLATDDWSRVGIDTAAGAVLFAEGSSTEGILGLGITDRDTFDQALAGLIERVDGANRHEKSERVGRRFHTIGRPFGDEVVPVLHWAHFGSFVLVARASGLETLEAVMRRLTQQDEGAPPSLYSDGGFAALAKKVPLGEIRLLVRAKASEILVGEALPIGDDSITSLRITPQGLSADIFMPFAGDALPEVFAGAPTLPLASRIKPDAVLVAMTRSLNAESLAALHKVGAIGRALDSSRQRLQASTGIDPEKEAIPSFAGPLTASLHLHDLEGLTARLRSRSLAGLLETLHFSLTAELKDPPAMLAILERSRAALAARGNPIRMHTEKIGTQQATLFEPDRKDPRFGWGIIGNTYVYAAGSGRLQLTLEAVAADDSGLPKLLEGSVGGALAQREGATVVILRGTAIAEAVARADLGGMLAGVIGSLVELVRSIGDVGLAISAEEGGLRVEIQEQLR